MFAEKMRRFRKRSGFTQAAMAEIFGVSQQTIAKWESGTVSPSVEALKKIAEYFHISVTDLIDDKVSDAEGTENTFPNDTVALSDENERLNIICQFITAVADSSEIDSYTVEYLCETLRRNKKAYDIVSLCLDMVIVAFNGACVDSLLSRVTKGVAELYQKTGKSVPPDNTAPTIRDTAQTIGRIGDLLKESLLELTDVMYSYKEGDPDGEH